MIVVRLLPLLLLTMAVEVPARHKNIVNRIEAKINEYAVTRDPSSLNYLTEMAPYIDESEKYRIYTIWGCDNTLPCDVKRCSSDAVHKTNSATRAGINLSKLDLFKAFEQHDVTNVMHAPKSNDSWTMEDVTVSGINMSLVKTKWTLFLQNSSSLCTASFFLWVQPDMYPRLYGMGIVCETNCS